MKKIVLIALFIYALIIAAGGAAYYMLSQRQEPAVQTEAQQQAAQKAAEEKAAAEKRAAERAAKQAQKADRSQKIDELKEKLGYTNGTTGTWYGFPSQEIPAPGFYLRPYVCHSGQAVTLKLNLYYRYKIDDGTNLAWIHGDHFAVTCDGAAYDFPLNPKERHDGTDADASGLSEQYAIEASGDMIQMLQQTAKSDTVTLQYYQAASGKVRSHHMASSELQHLRDVVRLYELMQEDLQH